MDEGANTTAWRDVSCRNLKWLFNLGEEKNIHPERILRGVSLPIEQLKDPSRFIDWESYATLVSNFSKYLSEEELLKASRHSWKNTNMRVYRVIGRLLFTLKDQSLAAFGPLGMVARLYPCEMSLFEVYPGHLKIVLEMHGGCTPCHTFHVLLAGQMIGLPESLGYPRATVDMTNTPRGATFDVEFQVKGGLLAPLRQVITWPFAAREAARELIIAHSSLLEKYHELHRVSARLTDAERRVKDSEAKYRLMATGVDRNIAEREALACELRDRKEIYRLVTTFAQDTIITIDERTRITMANPSTTGLFGYEFSELIGLDVTRLIPDFKLTDPPESMQSGMLLTGVRKDQSRVPLEISLVKHNLHGKQHFTVIICDTTFRTKVEEERKQLEQQLMASRKMESIGQLTGGIAHDFNNLLVAILGYAELGLNKRSDPRILKGYLTEIKLAGRRAAEMTQKLMAFSRRQVIEPDVINVNDLVYGLDLMIKRLLPENIDVRLSFQDESLNVMADQGQLEQVIVNLAVNARDAMRDGGRLNITTERVNQNLTDQNPSATEGDYVLIRVSDTGLGMSEAVRKRVFEPFYTTKPEGSGTGLGLAVVFDIVKQHGGFIDIQSEPGQGTSVKIYLPVSREKSITRGEKKPSAAVPVRGGNETLLIVEDNKPVRELSRLILRDAGYKVLVASNGQEALEIFRNHVNDIDLAILDVVMPRMGGKEVLRRMREIRPGISVIFTSGYSDGGAHAKFIVEEGLELVKKPFSIAEFRFIVRKVLDQTETDRPRRRTAK